MPRTLAKLFAPDRYLTGKVYLLLGISLFAVKFAIDSMISILILHRPWSPFNYLNFAAAFGFPDTTAKLAFVWTMLAISIPFITTGILLTARRLRSAGLPNWLVAIFFVPMVNFLFFLIISVHPGRRAKAVPIDADTWNPTVAAPTATTSPAPLNYARDQVGPGREFLGRFIPRSAVPRWFMAVLLPIPIALAFIWFGVNVLKTYGWGIFIGVPFVIGLFSVLIWSFHATAGFWESVGIAALSLILFAFALMAFAMEGAICIAMAVPIAFPITALGAGVGYMIQRASHINTGGTLLALLLFLPLFMGAEWATLPVAPIFPVTTSIEVNAAPDEVWKNVVAFAQLPPPSEFIFRAGVAYPIRAEIVGNGVGACRYCIFSTGQFEEPITAWDAPTLLKFDVKNYPPPMKEWSPFANIHPPHLDHFLVSKGGEFRLIELQNGRTRLEGTTWYQHHMWPAPYWRLWSDAILHKIHLRVLNHVKHLSEADQGAAR